MRQVREQGSARDDCAAPDIVENAADPRLRALLHRRGIQRKAQKEADAGGNDAAEREADEVADSAVEGRAAPPIHAQPAAISRKSDSERALTHELGEQSDDEATEVAMGGAPEDVKHVIISDALGLPVSEARKEGALKALEQMDEANLSLLLKELQNAQLLDELLDGLGKDKSEQTMGNLQSEIRVRAVAFAPVKQDEVAQQYENANRIFSLYGIKIVMDGFTQVGNTAGEKKKHTDEKSVLGNDEGWVEQDKALEQPFDALKQSGTLTSFWVTEIREKPGAEEAIGLSVQAKEDFSARGKEGVLVDLAEAEPDTFAHELGHIIGGKGAEAEHVEGPDGKGGMDTKHGDPENLMIEETKAGIEPTKLTPQQVAAFKTSIYAKITRVKPSKPGDFPDGQEKRG